MENKDQSNDPVVKLLQKGLIEMVKETNSRINSIENEIVNDLLAQANPNRLTFPTPLMAMLQVQKKQARRNGDKSLMNTQGANFTFKDNNGKEYDFMPLINANIIKGHVSDVRMGLLENTWDIVLELGEDEWIDDLSGMTIYIRNKKENDPEDKKKDIPEVVPVEQIILYSGQKEIPFAMVSDYNRLPFSDTLLQYMQYNEDRQLYKLLMHWHDILCSNAISYGIVQPYDSKEIPLQLDGRRIYLTLRLKSRGMIDGITPDNILLNCIPVINAKEKSELISADQIVKRLNMEDGEYLMADATSDDPLMSKRKYGTTREGVNAPKEAYIRLHTTTSEGGKYNHIHYLTTGAAEADLITPQEDTMETRSTLFATSVVVDVFPNCEVEQEPIYQLKKYYLQTHDRIVTPTDILTFCKTQLIKKYGYDEGQIKGMEWVPADRKAIIQLEGRKEDTKEKLMKQSIALESMIAKRTARATPITINIINIHIKQ